MGTDYSASKAKSQEKPRMNTNGHEFDLEIEPRIPLNAAILEPLSSGLDPIRVPSCQFVVKPNVWALSVQSVKSVVKKSGVLVV
jgi:hypothetical protein